MKFIMGHQVFWWRKVNPHQIDLVSGIVKTRHRDDSTTVVLDYWCKGRSGPGYEGRCIRVSNDRLFLLKTEAEKTSPIIN